MLPAKTFLINEARSLLSRLEQVKPFDLTMPTVGAASVSPEAMKGITDLIIRGNKELHHRVMAFIAGLERPQGRPPSPQQAQADFALLKLRFNALLDQVDIYADVVGQRAEHNVGVWVAGLDVLAADALRVVEPYHEPPPMVCYLERGHGAAIRRARTRLPGGDLAPTAIIQVPRERMIGAGIASSLIHEVGHQGAALLDLVPSLRRELLEQVEHDPQNRQAWQLFHHWISEIVADFWAMAHLGIGATLGLISVVSLPRYFLFRFRLDAPHPFPWIRVLLSIRMGAALYPHPQWHELEALWRRLYPLRGLDVRTRRIIEDLLRTVPAFVWLLIGHRPAALRGRTLASLFPIASRQPDQLRRCYRRWQRHPRQMGLAAPSLVFAVLGQAHGDGKLTARRESYLLSQQLTQWALARSENRNSPRQVKAISGMAHLLRA